VLWCISGRKSTTSPNTYGMRQLGRLGLQFLLALTPSSKASFRDLCDPKAEVHSVSNTCAEGEGINSWSLFLSEVECLTELCDIPRTCVRKGGGAQGRGILEIAGDIRWDLFRFFPLTTVDMALTLVQNCSTLAWIRRYLSSIPTWLSITTL